MEPIKWQFENAFEQVRASSSGGAPFLISYGLTFFITALLSLFLPLNISAMIAMFQGGAALPLAFWMEKKMSTDRMSPDNPLNQLSMQMAISQALGLPAMIAMYSVAPELIPLLLASLGGVHFMPYAWLHRTRLYIWLAAAVAGGAFLLQIFLAANEFTVILFWISITYWVAAVPIYRNAKQR